MSCQFALHVVIIPGNHHWYWNLSVPIYSATESNIILKIIKNQTQCLKIRHTPKIWSFYNVWSFKLFYSQTIDGSHPQNEELLHFENVFSQHEDFSLQKMPRYHLVSGFMYFTLVSRVRLLCGNYLFPTSIHPHV